MIYFAYISGESKVTRKVTFLLFRHLLGLSFRHILFRSDLRICQRTWGERCDIFSCERNKQHQTSQNHFKKRDEGKRRKGNDDGIEDPADPYRGNHPSSREERRKLLSLLQGQFTHCGQVRDQIWSQIFFHSSFHSDGFYAAQWVAIIFNIYIYIL